MKVSSVEEMRNLDRKAIEEYGIPEEILMENAGQAAYFVLRDRFGLQGRTYLVFCGGGNNGGDGFVVARKIVSSGGRARVFILGDPSEYKGAARLNLEMVRKTSAPVKALKSIEDLGADLAHCDGVVDAVFGTGLARDVGGLYAEVIHRINQSGKPVLALDIPSGVQGDTGRVMGVAVRADATVTFGLPKVGNLLYPGFDLGGELFVTHISFPPSLIEAAGLRVEINRAPPLPPRNPQGHKGTFGDVLFIAGASTYFGAPFFSALSFLRAGGGYSRLAAPASMVPFISSKASEVVFVPQEETNQKSISLKNLDALLELGAAVDMVVLGPGISLVQETQELARRLAAGLEKPLLLDGDGITALCGDLDILRRRGAPTVLTPHPGEMSRITGRAVPELLADPVTLLQETAADLESIVVLKGAHTLVGLPDGRVFINLSGNSGMASAGSGDVLTGTIAAMTGLGLTLPDAVRKGVFVHGVAGDIASRELGPDGMTAQDILDALPFALKHEREGLEEDLAERYAGPVLV